MNTTTSQPISIQDVAFYPVATTGRLNVGHHGLYKTVRRVHLATDVAEGWTLCGLDLVHVASAGKVTLDPVAVPWGQGSTWRDACPDCTIQRSR